MSDLIDRQTAIDAMNEWEWQELYLPIHFKQLLENLPPVKPEQKTGHWIREEHPDAMPTFTVTWRCSACGEDQSYGEPPFCPNCGSYNGGDEE